MKQKDDFEYLSQLVQKRLSNNGILSVSYLTGTKQEETFVCVGKHYKNKFSPDNESDFNTLLIDSVILALNDLERQFTDMQKQEIAND